jgi:hypothetical protein
VHLLQSRVDEAILWFEKARSAAPRAYWPHGYLAAADGVKGDTERADAELAKAKSLNGDECFSIIARLTTAGYAGARSWGVPKVRAFFEPTYFDSLRKAGVPEE